MEKDVATKPLHNFCTSYSSLHDLQPVLTLQQTPPLRTLHTVCLPPCGRNNNFLRLIHRRHTRYHRRVWQRATHYTSPQAYHLLLATRGILCGELNILPYLHIFSCDAALPTRRGYHRHRFSPADVSHPTSTIPPPLHAGLIAAARRRTDLRRYATVWVAADSMTRHLSITRAFGCHAA